MAIVSHNNVQSAPPSETALATAASSSESSVLTSGSNPPQPSLLPDDTKHCIRSSRGRCQAVVEVPPITSTDA
ncbi:unnamed protein product [Rhizoctonia solani]|uniref:Uncharacterized protein n=1 Tax=Rhizoctonia solani TaxID=456999 RepID=A0A8H3A3C3_9AGAM|nr:unnamed protein product [Rhizoctonia solani]